MGGGRGGGEVGGRGGGRDRCKGDNPLYDATAFDGFRWLSTAFKM